ncbi:hypothetical protein HU200_062305 [Digitaria exilis]|uniref:Cyclin N-terminal domain-containing protein n=1 Tax=Digitaria exilis TaxID=1010633 RepID=A0A835DVZ2_9POAL|nr:hypothetical protein HU200_062305 [Digitaria exilis]
MDSFATSWSLSRLAPPPAFEPFPYGGGAPVMHTNPFSFGLDIALPSPLAFPDGDHAHTNPIGFDPMYGGAAVHAQLNSNNPFSFGHGFAHPPLTGYNNNPFYYGGATAHAAYPQYSNPFAVVDPWDVLPPPTMLINPSSAISNYTHTGPTYIDDYASPAVIPTPYDSPRTPVYGNPFNNNAGDVAAGVSMHDDVPAPWECDNIYNGHVDDPAVNEPDPESPRLIPNPKPTAPACDDVTCNDIETTLRAQEDDAEARPSPDYLQTAQAGRMTRKMRRNLVSWMTDTCDRHDLTGGATLHRAVSYADRFLSARRLPGGEAGVDARSLNLLGAAAIFAAAKYECHGDVHKLGGAGEIARHGGFAGGKKEVVDMERELLAALGYRLGGPTAHTFVEHFFTRGYGSQEGEEGDVEVDELRLRAHDLADVSLFHYGCLGLKPSVVAAAAMFLARVTFKPSCGQMERWNKELKKVTGYKPKDLERAVDAIRSLVPKDDGNGNGFDIDILPVFYADPD